MKTYSPLILSGLLAGLLLLGACGTGLFEDKDKKKLEGERISVLEMQKSLEPDDKVLDAQGLITPEAWSNEFWPQAGGYPNHSMQNLALAESTLKKVWSADIGDGATNELPLNAAPVLAAGKIFALDTEGRLSAFDAQSGKKLWDNDVSDKSEDDPVITGGLAYSDNKVFVTNGYNEVLAVNPANGIILWRKPLPAPSRAAPTILENRLFVTTLDGRVQARDTDDGAMLWEYNGISENAGLIGAASPAANNDIVVPVFSSGEITALRVENGSVAWSDSLANIRGLSGLENIADIKALPIIDKGLIIAISFSGRLMAIDERTGTRIWQREIGGTQTPWMAGNHLFLVSSDNKLIALGRETGSIRWITQLPRFDSNKPVILNGPLLAGGRLIVTDNEGMIYEFSPETGDKIREWDAGSKISLPPIIAGKTMYILFDNGTLSAYR
ncbi:MAG: PQQ-binding-like beta-propeller repeat protein [Alphaproteobacteria bacterium]|nr:PQQ-binding-like beta-propeller repeat protein [Alphaproteobacteria bacterium]